jgi:hypothetical protein
VLQDAPEFAGVLRERFDLVAPELEGLWPGVWARHLQWQAEQTAVAAASRQS